MARPYLCNLDVYLVTARLQLCNPFVRIRLAARPIAICSLAAALPRILSAEELQTHGDGAYVCTAACIIARQRPGTAKGFIFLSMEDETGILNVIIGPEIYERERILISRGKFLLIEGKLQNQDEVFHVRAYQVRKLEAANVEVRSHHFH
jgi:error-prone DNA polymerase